MMVGLFALAISIGGFFVSFSFIKAYFSVKNWEKVEATILSKNVALHEKYSTGRSPYALNVEYSYNFNNQDYKGKNVYLADLLGGQANHMKETAEKNMALIKGKMPIWVNPNNPSQSVIFCEGIGLYFFVFGMAILALLIALTSFLLQK